MKDDRFVYKEEDYNISFVLHVTVFFIHPSICQVLSLLSHLLGIIVELTV